MAHKVGSGQPESPQRGAASGSGSPRSPLSPRQGNAGEMSRGRERKPSSPTKSASPISADKENRPARAPRRPVAPAAVQRAGAALQAALQATPAAPPALGSTSLPAQAAGPAPSLGSLPPELQAAIFAALPPPAVADQLSDEQGRFRLVSKGLQAVAEEDAQVRTVLASKVLSRYLGAPGQAVLSGRERALLAQARRLCVPARPPAVAVAPDLVLARLREGLAAAEHCTALEFAADSLEGVGLAALAPLLAGRPQLSELNFAPGALQDGDGAALVRLLAELPALRALSLAGLRLDAATSEHLAARIGALPALERLALTAAPLPPAAAAAWATALHALPRLRALDLATASLDELAPAALRQLLAAAPRLESLALSNNDLEGASAAAMLAGLASAPALRALELDDNFLHGLDAAAWSEFFRQHPALTHLEASSAGLGPAFAAAFAERPAGGAAIVGLQLNHSAIPFAELARLLGRVAQELELRELGLAGLTLSGAAGEHLGAALANLEGLTHLNLADTRPDAAAQARLLDWLGHLSALEELALSGIDAAALAPKLGGLRRLTTLRLDGVGTPTPTSTTRRPADELATLWPALRTLPQLTTLHLEGPDVAAGTVRFLAAAPGPLAALRTLYLLSDVNLVEHVLAAWPTLREAVPRLQTFGIRPNGARAGEMTTLQRLAEQSRVVLHPID